ncbi:hypothetical protein [Anaerosinus massiliensis]|uniref:hypothetical protein n=1 Tax=Massilibacillus massiliensis TaxID=1806837 RepID=UPI000DA62B36|nr:hypothetical protein [Massilibacillus massiliensis]
MDIKVQMDAQATLQAMEKSPETTLNYMRRALQESCRLVQRGAREQHKFKSRGGSLERAIRFRTNLKKCEGVIDINPAIASYGVFVHEPTGTFAPADKRLPSKFYRWADGSYAIKPVNKKMLRFLDKRGGFVFARKVRHPGTPADRFLYESADRNRAEINEIFARNNRLAIKEAGL